MCLQYSRTGLNSHDSTCDSRCLQLGVSYFDIVRSDLGTIPFPPHAFMFATFRAVWSLIPYCGSRRNCLLWAQLDDAMRGCEIYP